MSSVNVQKFKIAHLKPPLLRGGGFAEGEDGEVNNGTKEDAVPYEAVIPSFLSYRPSEASGAYLKKGGSKPPPTARIGRPRT